MPDICPTCGAVNQAGRSTCTVCGAELEITLFAEMFGPPRKLKDRYVIQRALQQGTSLSLYRAIDTRDKNQPCLVHQVSLSLLDHDMRELVEHRFLQETTAWQTRQHPNIIRILDADTQNHRLYLITEPVKGISLRTIIKDRRQSVPEQTLLHWAGQLCDALTYLHSQTPPVVLGCLSPATIHVDQAGHVELIEVGLVRYKRSGLLGPAKGVPGYAAPEQRRGQLTPLSDLYTLGIILYELVTRFDPKHRPLPPLKKYARDLRGSVLEAIARAYRRDPEKRHASAAEMRKVLLGSAVQSIPQLPAFALAENQTATTVPELVQLCAAHWDDGMLALINGRIVEWLTGATVALRQADRDQDADQVEQVVQRTTQAREQMERDADRTGITSTTREVARNAAFAAWLKDTGAMGIQPSLQVHPKKFDFGVVGATIKASSILRIRNQGQGYLTGRIDSQLPWLTIPDPVFGCRAGEVAEVRVEARGRRIVSGEARSAQAIHVVSNGGNAWIEAQAASSPPVLSVEPQALNYGPITRGASRVAHLSIANRGGGRLRGRILCRAPWLRVRHPDFSCPAGASARIAVELLSAQLPKGAVRIRRALAVDSDSGQAQLDVTWKWARPALELDTVGLDMGSVERGLSLERTLTLSNSGTADLVGESVSQVGWLTIQPAQFQCAPGHSQTLTVTCDTALLPGGSTVEPEAILIQANAGAQTLSASIEVLAPQLVIEPAQINMGDVWDGDQVEETVILGNRGSLPWEGRIHANVPWLTVEPEEMRCEPGHFMPATIVLNTESLDTGGEWTVADALSIEGQGEVRTIPVRMSLLRPELSVERRSLGFGLIGRTDIATLPLEITNSGTGELQWQAQVQGTWIEVLPTAGSCNAGETTTIQIKAYALAVDGDSGQAWLTINSNGGRTDLPASVALSSPQLNVEPLSIDLQSENYVSTSQAIRISNRGVGDLQGTVKSQVPWLTLTPQTFTCATGVSTQIQVQANLEGIKSGTYQAIDALLIESNGGSETVSASLALTLSPKLHIASSYLHFGHSPEQVLQLENQGYGTLYVQVIPREEWIAVNRQEWTIKAGKKAQVKIKLVDAPPGLQGAIDIRTQDETVSLPVQQLSNSHTE
jgi:serine/threonine-protein kinase